MKILSPKIHGIIDYLVVVFLGLSPMLFGMTGVVSTFTYALCGIHLLLTLLTDFSAGVVRIIPLPIHGYIELIVGFVLIALAFTLFKDDTVGKMFFTDFGIAVLVVFMLTDYKSPVKK